MLQWARHLTSGDKRFHNVSAVVFGGSVITRCNGRWPERDAVEEAEDPPLAERCIACDTAVAPLGSLHERFDCSEGDA